MPTEIIQVTVCVCAKCGRKWTQRKPKKPVKCPQCQSVLWDEEPKASSNGNAS